MAQEKKTTPLRKWRFSKGYTQDFCASKIGTSRQVWSDWERGRRRPNHQFMPRIRSFTDGAIGADEFYPPLNDAA